MKKILVVLLMSISLGTFAQIHEECLFEDDGYEEYRNGTACNDWYNYAVIGQIETLQIKTLRIAFHIIQDDNGEGNLTDSPEHIAFLNDVIDMINAKFGGLSQLNLGVSSPNVTDSRIRINVDDIYFHQNTTLWDFSSDVTTKANACYELFVVQNINLNEIQKYNTLHVFIGGNYDIVGGRASGFGNKKYIATVGWLYAFEGSPYAPYPLACSRNIVHEPGHSCGLYHNFHGGTSGSQCDDCYDNDPPSLACPVQCTSNNIMDYFPGGGGGFSQCQIGKMHYFLSGGAGNIGDIVVNECNNSEQEIVIQNNDNVTWEFRNQINSSIRIVNGGVLTIKCEISMPEGAQITVEPGGKLIIDGGTLTNRCGGLWQGISVLGDPTKAQSPDSNQGVVEVKNGAVIENSVRGIAAWDLDAGNGTATGGILKINGAVFRNNVEAVSWQPYQNFVFNNPALISDNRGFVINSTFETTDAMSAIGRYPYAFLSIWGVSGVTVRNNTFTNTNPESFSTSARG